MSTTTTAAAVVSNVLPVPSIQMARSLHNVLPVSVGSTSTSSTVTTTSDSNTSNTNSSSSSIISDHINSYDLFVYQMECGNTESAVDAMKRLYVVCLLCGHTFTIQTILPYISTLLSISQSQSILNSSNTNNTQSTTTTNSTATATTAAATTTATTTTATAAATESDSSTTTTGEVPPPSPGTLIAANTLSDEMLLLLGQQLVFIIQHITTTTTTNSSSSIKDLIVYLPIIERLCSVEETVVRDQAVTLAQTIMTTHFVPYAMNHYNNDKATIEQIVVLWINVAKRLQTADWFTSKVSCAGILPSILQLANTLVAVVAGKQQPQQQPTSYQIQIISLYRDLCIDETPMVRRAAAKYFGQMLYHISSIINTSSTSSSPTATATTDTTSTSNNNNTNNTIVYNFVTQTLYGLCHDEQDSVRLLAIVAIGQTASLQASSSSSSTTTITNNNNNNNYIPSFTIQHWISIVKDGATDLSWRVRNNLAKNFSDVANAIGIRGKDMYHNEQTIIMACYVAVLTDTEAEVRTAAVTHLARMIVWGGTNLYQHHIQSLLPNLADDVVMEVRSKCALALMDTAANKDNNPLDDALIVQHFGPLYEGFLQDEFHEVQLQVLGNLHKIAHLLPNLTGVVNSLLLMAKASNWRVREAVARLLPHLAEARGLEFFNTILFEPVWLIFLLDSVASVRNSIVSGVGLLVKAVGAEYFSTTVLPQHIRIYNQNTNTYLIRITILNAHVETALACDSSSTLWQEVMTQILRGLVDKVPNVRTITAKGLRRIVQSYNSDKGYGDAAFIQTQVVPALQKCISEETDVDCQPALQDALDEIKL